MPEVTSLCLRYSIDFQKQRMLLRRPLETSVTSILSRNVDNYRVDLSETYKSTRKPSIVSQYSSIRDRLRLSSQCSSLLIVRHPSVRYRQCAPHLSLRLCSCAFYSFLFHQQSKRTIDILYDFCNY